MSQEKDIFKQGSTTYYFSSKFFPKKIRDDVFKLYSFVRVVDNYVDEKPNKPTQLATVTEAYNKAIDDVNFESITHQWDELETRIVKNIVQVSRKFKFDPTWVPAFLAAMKSDLHAKPYNTLNGSLEYVYGSAEVIGLMMARILKVDSRKNIRHYLHVETARENSRKERLHKRQLAVQSARVKSRFKGKKDSLITDEAIDEHISLVQHYASMQGRAMQWINFVRDIAEDNELGRRYIPTEDLKKCGLKDITEATARDNPEAFKKLIDIQLKRYREWQEEATQGFKYIPRRLRVPLQTAVDMYDWTAKQIEKDPLVIYEKKIKPPAPRVLFGAGKSSIK